EVKRRRTSTSYNRRMDGYRKAQKKSILEAWAQEGLVETAVEEMIIHVNGDDSDSETSDLEDFADEYRVQTDQGTQEIYVNRMYADVRWRAPSDVLFSVFGKKVTVHGSARTNQRGITAASVSPLLAAPPHASNTEVTSIQL
ncbi:hypothetical protein J6590_038419, partial [Homalodisca vitripennis]